EGPSGAWGSGAAGPSVSMVRGRTASVGRETRMPSLRPRLLDSCVFLPGRGAQAFRQASNGSRVQSTSPRLRESERRGYLIESLSLEVMAAHQGTFVFGQVIEGLHHELAQFGLGERLLG